jgi:hypothetical protein
MREVMQVTHEALQGMLDRLEAAYGNRSCEYRALLKVVGDGGVLACLKARIGARERASAHGGDADMLTSMLGGCE